MLTILDKTKACSPALTFIYLISALSGHGEFAFDSEVGVSEIPGQEGQAQG